MTDDFDDWPKDDEGESDVVTCPMCGTDIYEDAEQCPACGEWIISSSTHPFAGRGLWFIGIGLLGVVATIVALILAGF